MIIFVNNKNEIKDVDSTDLKGLTALEIDDVDNPFEKWSKAKICCYKATVIGGKVTMMTPYLDSRLIKHIEQLGNQTENNASEIMSTQDAVCESSMITEERFLDVETALCESSMETEERFETVETLSDARFLELETALCDLSEIIFNE